MLHAGGLLKALRLAAQPLSALAGPASAAFTAGTLHVGDSDSLMVEIRMPDGRSVRVSMSRRQFGQYCSNARSLSCPPIGTAIMGTGWLN